MSIAVNKPLQNVRALKPEISPLFILAALGFEPRALCVLSMYTCPRSHTCSRVYILLSATLLDFVPLASHQDLPAEPSQPSIASPRGSKASTVAFSPYSRSDLCHMSHQHTTISQGQILRIDSVIAGPLLGRVGWSPGIRITSEGCAGQLSILSFFYQKSCQENKSILLLYVFIFQALYLKIQTAFLKTCFCFCFFLFLHGPYYFLSLSPSGS